MIELATPETAKHIVDNIRDRDADEIWHFSDETPQEHIFRNARLSYPNCWIVRAPDGEPANIWGLTPDSGSIAQAWLFSTHRTVDAKFALARSCRKTLRDAKRHFTRIVVYSDPRKEDARDWNELCGFKFIGFAQIDGTEVMEFQA